MKYNESALVNQLTRHEGVRLFVYKDHLGIDTIGIGRNLEGRGITIAELAYMGYESIDDVYDHGISLDVAEHLLVNDIQIVETELARAHPCIHNLDDVRQRVVIDMAFNLGVPRLLKFKNMWGAIHAKDYVVAAEEMLDSKWANQVQYRARTLAEMMRTGVDYNG